MALSLRTSVSVRPVASRTVKVAVPLRPVVLARAELPKAAVEQAIKEAEETCADGTTQECASAWDVVEEVSAVAADKAAAEKAMDPLEKYCEESPDADECRVYDE